MGWNGRGLGWKGTGRGAAIILGGKERPCVDMWGIHAPQGPHQERL